MKLVNNLFYVWYNRVTAAIGGIIAVTTITSWMVPSLMLIHMHLGLTPIVGVLGLMQFIYGTIFFKRQTTPWVGALLAAMFMAILNISLIQSSGQLGSWFLVMWAVQTFLAGMFGLYVVVGYDFLLTIYFVMNVTSSNHHVHIDVGEVGPILGAYIISILGYLLWRRLYIDQESQRVSQLTGQLRSNQQQAEILIQSISDGIIVTDTAGKISLLNPAAAKMTGWPVEEAVGIDVQLVAKLLEEDGKEIAASLNPFKQVLNTSKQYSGILQLNDRDGKQHQVVSLVISPVVLPKSTEPAGTVAVFRDVSAARQEEHRRADFISTASHEMRTPVAAIEGYLALALNEKVSQIDSKARAFLVKAHESTQRLGTLFQDLLTSAKAEDGRLVNHPVVTEIGEFLEKLTDGLRFAAEKKGLLMDFNIGSGAETNPVTAVGGKVVRPLYYADIDPDRMQEVVTNLFDNAVKYTETGKITIGLTGNEEIIQFFIRDTGHGIPAEDIPHLFQKFYRVDNTATRTIGGTGLGLFISRKIVETYNGRIWVESQVGQGSTFYINLPRLSSQRASELQAGETVSTM